MKLTIFTRERRKNPKSFRWIAYFLQARFNCYTEGGTKEEAIGKLITFYAKELGIKME